MKSLGESPRSLLVLVALLLMPALRAEDLPQPLLDEMNALNARVSDGFLNKDIDLVMSCYANTPDVQLVANGEYARGPEAIRQGTLAVFNIAPIIRNECLSIKYTRVGELVVVVGTERNTFMLADGTVLFALDFIWSDVRKKIDGNWVMILNHVTQLP